MVPRGLPWVLERMVLTAPRFSGLASVFVHCFLTPLATSMRAVTSIGRTSTILPIGMARHGRPSARHNVVRITRWAFSLWPGMAQETCMRQEMTHQSADASLAGMAFLGRPWVAAYPQPSAQDTFYRYDLRTVSALAADNSGNLYAGGRFNPPVAGYRPMLRVGQLPMGRAAWVSDPAHTIPRTCQ